MDRTVLLIQYKQYTVTHHNILPYIGICNQIKFVLRYSICNNNNKYCTIVITIITIY